MYLIVYTRVLVHSSHDSVKMCVYKIKCILSKSDKGRSSKWGM